MIAAYWKERFPLTTFVPLALVIALAAAGSRFEVEAFGPDAVAALLLLAEFRLWDDLADRRGDAVAHPERVMVRSGRTWKFVLLCLTLGTGNLAWTAARDRSGIAATVLIVVHAALGAWYLTRHRRSVAGDQLLLAKYPAFVFIVAGTRSGDSPVTTTLLAVAIYLAASGYEAWHDPVSPLGTFLGGRS